MDAKINATVQVDNDMYEKQLNGLMQKLLTEYLRKFHELPIERKEELVADIRSHIHLILQ